MKLYRLESRVAAGGDVVNLADPKGRISSFFIWGEGEDKPFRFFKPKAVAQSRVQFADIASADYVQANIGVPIFSENARTVLKAAFPNDLAFYECVVDCRGHMVPFYLGKVLRYLPLVDEAHSEFRTLSEDERVLTRAVYLADGLPIFSIARDERHRERLVVSELFVNRCKATGLTIDFAEPV